MISNINYVKKVMQDLKAKKRYGQNFLIDENITDKIAKLGKWQNGIFQFGIS